MKNSSFIFTISFCIIFAQVPTRDLNKLSNEQLDRIKEELQRNSQEIITERVPELSNPSSTVLIASTANTIDTEDYFGYNYFRKDISFFDNIPTPADYKLGPGDEIILSLWGENNSRNKMTINKDGMIYFENIGFINLSNKTLESAELVLTEELSKIYSNLKSEDNPTTLMLELGKLKSINIYLSGQIENPGINLIHPFSDIFSAIVQAGGVKNNGSLREVQLIRNNKIIAKVDFYSFFMDGENTFSNVKLIDGDVIHIPNVKKRVSISGAINRPFSYELLSGESLSDLIKYASGFTSAASSSIILDQIIPVEERLSDDNARTKIALNFKNSQSKALNNGDSVKVLSITDVDLSVEVFGRVKSPGIYPANNSLKYILDIAGGFDDPVFRQTIIENEIKILRKDSNQFYGTELTTSYDEADKLQLLPNDKVLVYENINYNNTSTYRVEGEVQKPGTYPFKEGLTVSDALELAGGITVLSSLKNIVVYSEFTNVDKDGITKVTKEIVGNVDLDFILSKNSILTAIPYENVVNIQGNVYNPGVVAFSEGLTVSGAIELAGGYKPYSLKKRTYIKRVNGEINKVGFLRGKVKRIYGGDTIVVPIDPNPSDFEINNFIADLSTTLANLAAVIFIIDQQSN